MVKSETTSGTPKRAFVVLGMHRGGTSTSMRALQALGVEVGHDLLDPIPDQNPRGFFEDEPLLRISDEVLAALELTWDSPRLVPDRAWEAPRLAELELEAVASIRERFADFADWGFKNPRTVRLLPFWRRVLARAGRSTSYVIVLRNPISVAISLHLRNDLSARRAHLLWLLHMSEAVLHTRGEPRICIDYDALVESPYEQLARVARKLGLPMPARNGQAYREFADDFLSADLQSSRFEAADLELEPDLSALARSAHALLTRWSSDDPDLSPSQLMRTFRRIQGQIEAFAPILADLSETDRARQQALWSLASEEAALEELRRSSQERERELGEVSAALDRQSRELEASRSWVGTLETQASDRSNELHESLRVSALLGERVEHGVRELEQARSQIAETEHRLGSEREQLAAVREQLEQAQAQTALVEARSAKLARELETQSTDIQSLREEQSLRDADHERRLSALRHEHRHQSEAAEDRAEILSQRLAEAETIRAREKRITGELKREKDARDRELEHLQQVVEVRDRERRQWLQAQTAWIAGQFVDHIEAMAQTRHWRLTRAMQRGLSRLRRRTWIDGMAQLRSVAQTLRTTSQGDSPDLRHLAALASDVQRTLRDLSGGELFGLGRAATALRWAVRLRRRPEGPFEFLRSRIDALEFHLQQSSAAPGEASALPARDIGPEIGPIVDIVIPVYRAREATLRCIESVLGSESRTPCEIIVIDDASGDSRLDRRLEAWASEGVITLLRNERNLGFPATANRGMTLHPDRDVVLLNSDTMVHADWLDRLRRSAHGDWRVATATPFSNNAEICSYPALCRADEMPSEQALATLDAFVARANPSQAVTLPTAVGFCMYIRREAIREVGPFDADRFGRGYGEENDFCLRARAQGFRHVLAADVFVAHEGGVSFSDERKALIDEGLAELDRLHPGYRAEIQDFLDRDPVHRLRSRIDVERLVPGDRRSVLMVSHSKGGGTHRHVTELARHLEDEGTPALLLQPSLPGGLRLSRPDGPAVENLDFRMPEAFDDLVAVLRQARVGHVHLQHLLEIDPIVHELPKALGCEFDATLHDYMSVCPRIHVTDDRGRYCGLPEDEADCRACVKRNGSPAGFEVDIAGWRSGQLGWLSGARRIFVPSEDTRTRLAPRLPGIELTLRPHPERFEPAPTLAAPTRSKRVRRIAVIGAIGPHKGAEILQACATDAAQRKLPLEFRLIGYSDRDRELLETKKVTISGAYQEDELEGLLRKARCHLAFIPSLWPETYCYTLSAAFRWQIHPVAFALGAVAERIESAGWGDLIPLDSSPQAVNDALLAVEPQPFPPGATRDALGARYPSFLDDYYDGLIPGPGD